MRNKILGLSLAVLLYSLGSTADAYFTTDQKAIRIDEQHVLYTVSYAFGSKKYDYLLPILTEYNSQFDREESMLTYATYTDDEIETQYGTTSGIVLSEAKIKNGMYFIPKGEARKFQLVVLLTLPETVPGESSDLSLLVTNLPFTMISHNEKIQGRLNPSELQYYRTPESDVSKAKGLSL